MTVNWDENEFDEDDEAFMERKLNAVRSGDIGVQTFGYVVGDTTDGDGQYAENLFKSSRVKRRSYDPSLYYFGRPAPPVPDFAKIRRALESFEEIDEEGGERGRNTFAKDFQAA